MSYDPTNPLIVQGDRTILVEVDNPRYTAARDALAPFAELEKSPEHIHTYRLTSLSLWNAAAAGLSAEEMVNVLRTFSKFPLPTNLATDLAELVGRYGRVRLEKAPLIKSPRLSRITRLRVPRVRQQLRMPLALKRFGCVWCARIDPCWKNWLANLKSVNT